MRPRSEREWKGGAVVLGYPLGWEEAELWRGRREVCRLGTREYGDWPGNDRCCRTGEGTNMYDVSTYVWMNIAMVRYCTLLDRKYEMRYDRKLNETRLQGHGYGLFCPIILAVLHTVEIHIQYITTTYINACICIYLVLSIFTRYTWNLELKTKTKQKTITKALGNYDESESSDCEIFSVKGGFAERPIDDGLGCLALFV